MKLEEQVCSLELAKKLKELGVKQESYFWYYELYGDNAWSLGPLNKSGNHTLSAFTVAELGEMLEGTEYTVIRQNGGSFFFKQMDGSTLTYGMLGGHDWGPLLSEADARATLLVHVIEKNLLERVA